MSTGATAPTAAAGELALGFYADSGFSNTLAGDPSYTVRSNVSPTNDMELLVQDHVYGTAGATPNPGTTTGAKTPWMAATVVLKAASVAAPTAPDAPTAVAAAPGDGQATVSWTAPPDNGSPITGYTVTPYAGATALTPKQVTGTPPATSTTIGGLTNGTAYTFTVKATNAIGTGPASGASNAVTPGNSPAGQWGSLMDWPMVAVHSVLLKTGDILLFDGWQQPQPTTVWNPVSQTFPTTLNAPGSIFCGANAHLPDGRIIVAGGDGVFTTGKLGSADTAIFDPATGKWSRAADMHMPRWYASLTELADGRYVTISGNSDDATTWAETPEVYDPATNTWTLLTGVTTPQVHEEEYPFSFLAPNGKVFTIGPSEDNSFLLDVNAKTWTPVGGASGVVNGSSVMYRPGKILYSGGATASTRRRTSKATASVIDLDDGTPTWRRIASMNHARDYHTLTNLADGTVLAVGGEQTSDQSVVTSGVLPAEIWNPSTEPWTDVAPMAAARNYHSTAVLMPDARVLVAGGGHYQSGSGPGQFSAQYYSPPYLFKGARPTISAAPGVGDVRLGDDVHDPGRGSIRSVNLVSLGADTHQSDMDQHFVPLTSPPAAGSLNVQAPATAALAPPGDYMVFIVDDKGVPSVAKIVHLAATVSAPSAPAAPTAIGGDGQATVSWTAPADGGSPITSYKVTPYAGSTALPATTVSGSPRPDQRRRRRAGERDGVHVQGQGRERGRDRRRLPGVQRGHAGREHRPAAVRAAGVQARGGDERGRAAAGRVRDGQPPGRADGDLEQRRGDRVRGDRLGRQHVHRADALQGGRQHGDERLERAGHGRRRHAPDRDGEGDRERGHRRRRCSSTPACRPRPGRPPSTRSRPRSARPARPAPRSRPGATTGSDRGR